MKVRKDNGKRSKRSSTFKGKVLYSVHTRTGYLTVRSAKCIPTKNNGLNEVSSKKSSDIKSFSKETVSNGNAKASPAQQKKTVEGRLNPALLETGFVKFIKKKWANGNPFTNKIAEFVSSPFKVVTVRRLFSSNKFLEQLRSDLLSVPFHRGNNDLFSFEQTKDLIESNVDSPAISSFLQLLSGPLSSWMENVSGKKLSGKLTVTGSKYRLKDHLLCHDDNLHDRSIAFILYLSKDWKETDGGALQLFSCDKHDQPEKVVHSIIPEFGAFAFFEVTSKSYHHVQEVLSDKERLSINGWFHGEKLPEKIEICGKAPTFHLPLPPIKGTVQKFFRQYYYSPKSLSTIKQCFREELSVKLVHLLREGIYHDLGQALLDEKIVWKKCGPPLKRNYRVAKQSTLPLVMQEFLQFLKSQYMFYFLSEISVDINPESKPTPVWHLEVQRWSPGDYMLATENDPDTKITGIDVHIFFNVQSQQNGSSGTMHYLGPDKDEEGFLEENAQLVPENNASFIVARISGMLRVTKYIDHCHGLHFDKIIATYCQE